MESCAKRTQLENSILCELSEIRKLTLTKRESSLLKKTVKIDWSRLTHISVVWTSICWSSLNSLISELQISALLQQAKDQQSSVSKRSYCLRMIFGLVKKKMYSCDGHCKITWRIKTAAMIRIDQETKSDVLMSMEPSSVRTSFLTVQNPKKAPAKDRNTPANIATCKNHHTGTNKKSSIQVWKGIFLTSTYWHYQNLHTGVYISSSIPISVSRLWNKPGM